MSQKTQENLEKAKKLLDELCAETSLSIRGCFAPVIDNDVEKLYRLFDLIVRSKFEEDADGDVPINIKVIDRTKHGPDHYEPVEYVHKLETKEDEDRCLRDLLYNLRVSTNAVSKFCDIIDARNRRK